MVKVSVVIPIYNVEEYLQKTLECFINQTLSDIEIICVDDGSTDGSAKLVEKYESKDKRVRLIKQENKGAGAARNTGMEYATGEYIYFFDGDDYCEHNFLESVVVIADEEKADIVVFNYYRVDQKTGDKTLYKSVNKSFLPNNVKSFSHYNVPNRILNIVTPTPWNKLYNRAFIVDSKLKFMELSTTNDITFAALSVAKADKIVYDENAYMYYRVNREFALTSFKQKRLDNVFKAVEGLAIEAKKLDYYEKIKNSVAYFRISNLVYALENYAGDFLNKYYKEYYQRVHEIFNEDGFDGIEKENFGNDRLYEKFASIRGMSYSEMLDTAKPNLLNESISNWLDHSTAEGGISGFDELLNNWGPTEVITNLCEKHYNQKAQIADMVLGAKSLKVTKKEVKTIGLFYFRISHGGVQRVISLLLPMYKAMGYEVVLFVQEETENDYPLPEGVKKVLLPPLNCGDFKNYKERAKALSSELIKNNIDVLLYHASLSNKLLFEVLIAKSIGISVIVTLHETVFRGMLDVNTELAVRVRVLRLADAVTVLSRADEQCWRLLGINAIYAPNPLQEITDTRTVKTIEKNCLVWIGRLDFNTKKCMDLIDIMAGVVPQVPDAKLLIVGGEVSENAMELMQCRIDELNLQDNIVLCGGTSDVEQYYKKADVCLLTSVSESFSMVIAESKAYGIPFVMYEIPQLEMVQGDAGVISVPQGGIKEMTSAIVSLLKDEAYKERMGAEAKKSLEKIRAFDLEGTWRKLIENTRDNSNNNEIDVELDENTLKVLLKSLLIHYEAGSTRKKAETWALKKQIVTLEESEQRLEKRLRKANNIKNSHSFKVGKLILAIPRKIIRLLRKIKKKLT